jgi:ABC-type antimicrobial peptide transport system permease subunit
MNIFKLSFSQNKSRYYFTLIGLAIAGIILIFSLFYTSAIEHSVAQTLPLKEGEMHLYVDEENYKEIPINYYERLKENFEVLIPFVKTERIYNGKTFGIIGTDINGSKLFVNQEFIDFEISKQFTTTTNYPKIYIHESYQNELEGLIIPINQENFEVCGLYKCEDAETNKNNFIISLKDYSTGIDPTIINNDSEITKYIITDYFIKTSLDEQTAINKIISIYETPGVRYFISTFKSLLQREMDSFLLFKSIPTIFFILVAIFSILNIYVAISLTIKERKHFYKILTILGMKLRHLKKIILIEVSLISLIATVISFFMGLFISFIIVSSIDGLTFTWSPIGQLLIALMAMFFVPIVQTLLSIQTVKYKQIIN